MGSQPHSFWRVWLIEWMFARVPGKKVAYRKRAPGSNVKEEIMRHVEVEYQDGVHTFVDDYSLENLIKSNQIKRFYRPSEKHWITVGIDPVRSGKGNYCGMERRRTGRSEEMIPWREREKGADCVSR